MEVQDDWRQPVSMIEPIIAETQARNAGITRSNIANRLQIAFEGTQVGVFREGDELLPIIARAPSEERLEVNNLHDVQMWSPAARQAIPLSQVVMGFETRSENSIVRRRHRLPTITVKCNPREGEASVLFKKVKPKIEAIELPQGYTLEWGGEYEDSADAQAGLISKLPMVFLFMVLIVIFLFNSIKQPMVIFLTVPLALIGVTTGLLLTGQPFGFMALLGILSLIGMMIKNAIVLIDEINVQIAEGKTTYLAIVDAGVSRARPVSMAALTTVLGMLPLVTDAFFVSMAVTVMFGLTFATVLTLVIVPVFYAIIFRVKE